MIIILFFVFFLNLFPDDTDIHYYQISFPFRKGSFVNVSIFLSFFFISAFSRVCMSLCILRPIVSFKTKL